MSKTTVKTADFLRAMQTPLDEPTPAPGRPRHAPEADPKGKAAPPRRPKVPRAKVTTSRDGLKHFGGYLDDATMEKIALLRIRLKLDNSELITRAIDELAKKHSAARAFGDA
jgi:hypothetical protein